MALLNEKNFGRHKNELVLGLCSNVSARIPSVSTVVVKHCIAAFKYLFNYLVVNQYISSMRLSCPACNNVENSPHSCEEKLSYKDAKAKSF